MRGVFRSVSPLTRLLLPLTLLLLTGCDPTLPPLRGQMEIGRDPYAVFVGGEGPNSDLYAVRPDGGPPVRITFTNVAELAPGALPGWWWAGLSPRHVAR